MKVLVLYAHPAQQHSQVNSGLAKIAGNTEGVSFVDLYAKYPRMDIDVEVEQKRLLEHDAVVFQFPMMWYSTPPLLKEWLDLVLEYGFAYGEGGDALAGKIWLSAITAGAPETAYGREGHNKFELRELLSPLEATANLCKMPFVAPYTLYGALSAKNQAARDAHINGYRTLLEALRDDRFDVSAGQAGQLLTADGLSNFVKGAAK